MGEHLPLLACQPGAPDNHVVGLGRRILVQFGKPLGGDDARVSSFAALAHQTDDSLGRFGIARAALRTVDMRLVEDHQCRPPKLARQMNERIEKQLYKLTTLGELKLVEINYCGNLA